MKFLYDPDVPLEDFRHVRYWKAMLAEFLGTFFLLFLTIGTVVTTMPSDYNTNKLTIAFTFGFTLCILYWIFGHVSGAHFNPAVTIGMLVARRISLLRAILYIAMQILGALAGAGLIYSIASWNTQRTWFGCTVLAGNNWTSPAGTIYDSNGQILAGPGFSGDASGAVGVNSPAPLSRDSAIVNAMGINHIITRDYIGYAHGLLVEFIITAVLVMVYLACLDMRRVDTYGSGSLAVGFAYFVLTLFAVPWTMASMNPARSLATAVVRGEQCWNNHWIYWIGPLLGGLVAGLLYDFVFASDASWKKLREYRNPQYIRTEHIEIGDARQPLHQVYTKTETVENPGA